MGVKIGISAAAILALTFPRVKSGPLYMLRISIHEGGLASSVEITLYNPQLR